MSWNYAFGVKPDEVEGSLQYGVVEEYHIEGSSGWTDFVMPAEDSKEKLLKTLKRMVSDLEKDINNEPRGGIEDANV